MNFSDVAAFLALIISAISFYWAKKSFVIQKRMDEYSRKTSAYEKLQKYFASLGDVFSAENEFLKRKIIIPSFDQDTRLFRKELKDYFGQEIDEKVENVLELYDKVKEINYELGDLFDAIQCNSENEDKIEEYRDAIDIMKSEEIDLNEYKKSYQILSKIESIDEDEKNPGQISHKRYLDLDRELQNLSKEIQSNILEVNNELLKLIKYDRI